MQNFQLLISFLINLNLTGSKYPKNTNLTSPKNSIKLNVHKLLHEPSMNGSTQPS